jgi:SAM-dependent methyltransferase
MIDFAYVGSELDLFSTAVHWKAYWRSQIEPLLGADVLEVGAGIGGTTKQLCRGRQKRWVCLEPDKRLAQRLAHDREEGSLPAICEVSVGTLADLGEQDSFDTLLYIDVLEHIEEDGSEIERACDHLRTGGHLIVLSPAHQWLYTPFDKEIGHYRRYTKRSLVALTPQGLSVACLKYLDAVGLFASLGNRLILNSKMPSPKQIAFWDNYMVPLSRFIDPLLIYSVGKSVLCVWRRN